MEAVARLAEEHARASRALLKDQANDAAKQRRENELLQAGLVSADETVRRLRGELNAYRELHAERRTELALLESDPRAHRLLGLAAHVPGPFALAIAASRIRDRWHHPADVVAGLALGVTCAAFCQRVCFAKQPHVK